MPKKTYRPKADVKGLRLSFPTPGGHEEITRWPYSTEDTQEQAYLDSREELTDKPAPKKKRESRQETPPKESAEKQEVNG